MVADNIPYLEAAKNECLERELRRGLPFCLRSFAYLVASSARQAWVNSAHSQCGQGFGGLRV